MLGGTYRCGAAAWRAVRGVARTAFVIACGGLMAAGCTTSGQPVLGATASGGSGQRTVAFESIDGPPETLFRKLVMQLSQEASARQVAMVSRESPAQYRIRGYVAAHVLGKKTTITWVWDIYDTDRERAARLTGEVPGAPSERAWAAADDAAVSRMARDGMSRLAAFLANPGPAPAEFLPPREEPSPNVASVSGTEGSLAFLPPLQP
jgi:hypothetical protein